MEIDANSKWGAVNGMPAANNSPITGPKPSVAAETDGDTFTNSTALEGNLSNTPDVRSEVVANAKRLVNNSQYPSGDTLKTLSNFLANKLSTSQE